MKKPDYCPEWFDIFLYDNLKEFSRDALTISLWTRRMNYKSFLAEEPRGGIEDREKLSTYAIEFLVMMATTWLEVAPMHRDSQTKENYNPLAVEPNIIQELTLIDIARIYTESYVEIPEMYKFFKDTEDILNLCVQHKNDGGNAHKEWLSLEDIMPESTAKEDIKAMEKILEMPLSAHSNYADIFVINLAQSDEILKMAFEQKLKEIRAKEQQEERTRRYSDAEIRKIVEYRVFAYIDLYTFGVITNRKFTDVEMAAMIYPPTNNTPLDFDAVDRIARTVRPKAIELLERANPRLLL